MKGTPPCEGTIHRAVQCITGINKLHAEPFENSGSKTTKVPIYNNRIPRDRHWFEMADDKDQEAWFCQSTRPDSS